MERKSKRRGNPADTKIRDLDLDSGDAVELTMAIEEKFGREISGNEAAELFYGDSTVADLVNWLAIDNQ